MSRKNRKPQLNLYADECIPQPSVKYLRSKGISVVHAFDINFVAKKDELHLKKSKSLHKALLTLDADFYDFKSENVARHPGILRLSSGDITPKHLNLIIDKVLKHINNDLLKESIITVSLSQIKKTKNNKTTIINKF